MCVRTELEIKVHRDIQSEILNYYARMEIPYRADVSNPEHTIIDFFAYLYKTIPVVKRRVEYSDELEKKIHEGKISREQVDNLRKYQKAFEDGKDMNAFLSNKTSRPDKIDFLLYAWHLHHLHLSGKFEVTMKNNRSDTLLLCVVNNDCVYFVDVIAHPKKAENFFNLHYLEIIKNNNWMEHIGFYEIAEMVPGTLEPKISRDKDIFAIYSKEAMNISFEFEGKGYCSLDPITLKRNPSRATEQMIRINKNIRKLNDLADDYKKFRFERSKEGFLIGIVEFENPGNKILEYNIF